MLERRRPKHSLRGFKPNYKQGTCGGTEVRPFKTKDFSAAYEAGLQMRY